MADSTLLGRLIWYELLTSDAASAATFYTKLIGWKGQALANGPSAPYTLFLSGKRQVAGGMRLPQEARQMGAHPHWLTYVGTPDVDATARHAAVLGGTIVKAPEDIPSVGRFAVVKDPQGALFALYAPLTAGEDLQPAVGGFSWLELATTDVRGALKFYKALFGWQQTSAMDMGPGLGTYQMWGRGGTSLGGMYAKPAQMPGPSSWLPYIFVADSKKIAAAVSELGGTVINGPMEVPGGWIAQGLDPQGAMFAVHSLSPDAGQMPVALPTRPRTASRRRTGTKRVGKVRVAKKAVAKKKALKKAPAKKSARRKQR